MRHYELHSSPQSDSTAVLQQKNGAALPHRLLLHPRRHRDLLHRRLCSPPHVTRPAQPDQQVDDDLISDIPYSDGFNHAEGNHEDYVSRIRDVGWKTLSAIVRSLAECGRPVTCVILNLPWMADIGCHYGTPFVLYWIQRATIFAVYHLREFLLRIDLQY
ncbi:UDP-glucoronosyl and UDP-glucosyl transferase [Musa troglodytarum]|uniref:UDP-glucoronosyl and UDP-glucosyl transferase n=1 Tax=Musa troglodytarum TaxID=320322 RepID=A0A9E7L9M8_9LILI|nr:UDP-glucoronosyl and UDP-glucosyl transferase [Musa troglodytarum]